MKTSVRRWGNSLALRIPRAYAVETKISADSEVELTVKSGSLVIQPVVRKRHSLADLLKQITAKNRHDVIETGQAVGKEVW